MLRVLTLSTLFPDAGRPNFGVFVERQTAALAALPEVEVRVVAPVGVPPGLGWLPRYRALAGLPPRESWHGLSVERPRFAVVPGAGGRFHAGSLIHALRPVLARVRRDFAFDVIDASFFFPDGPAAVALGRHFGVPVSIKARGADIHHWGRAPATRDQVRAAGQAADGLLAVSQALSDDMVALGLPPARVHRTGVDQGRFRPVERVPGPPHVVSLGALIPRKGHEVVIRAVARLPGVRLTVAGEGPERRALDGLIATLGVGDRVRLAGSVPHDALPALLQGADVMALASASEGLANAWVEALACGTPVVVTDAGGARELVRCHAAGRVVARDADAFATAIGELLAAPPPRKAVRATVADYSWQRNARDLHAHLAALVSARAR